MAVTWYEQGLEEGQTRGFAEGQRRLAQSVIEGHFGALDDRALSQLQSWPRERLAELVA